MYICNSCKETVHNPTHMVNGKLLCTFCNEPNLTPKDTLSEDILMMGLMDISDGSLDGDFDFF